MQVLKYFWSYFLTKNCPVTLTLFLFGHTVARCFLVMIVVVYFILAEQFPLLNDIT
jgi:hypothetical protein